MPPESNLQLDRVTHVSLVDEPAVSDSEFVVMKAAEGEPPASIEEALSDQDAEQSNEDPNMDDEKIEELVEGVEKAAEAAADAAESAEEAAEAASAEPDEGGSGTEETPEGETPEGGQETQEENQVSEATQERLEQLEEMAVEAGLIEEDEALTQEGQETEEAEEDLPEDVEKRLEAIEKGLQREAEDGGGRKGEASALDSLGDDDITKSATGTKDIMGQVKKSGGD